VLSNYPLPSRRTPISLAITSNMGYHAAAEFMLNAIRAANSSNQKQNDSLTTTASNSYHWSHTANNASCSTQQHTFHTPASHNHYTQTDYRSQHHPCPYPFPRPYYHVPPAVECRSLRSAAVATLVQLVPAWRRWVGRAVRVTVSKKNAGLTFAVLIEVRYAVG
jgi:hypothetical protein